MTKKELQSQSQSNSNQLAVNSQVSNLAAQELGIEDFIIPRILLMQGTSTMLSDGDFNLGDIIHATEERRLAGKGETVEIIPFYINKTYETFKVDGGDWVSRAAWGSGNPDKEWEETISIDGQMTAVKNLKNYNIYVLLAGEEDAFPCIISFRSTAGKEAKKITSHFMLMSRLKKPAYNVVWDLGSEMITKETANGKKALQKYTIKKGRAATNEEIDLVSNWLEAVAQNLSTIQVADAPVKEEEVAETVEVTPKKEVKNFAPKASKKAAPSDELDGDMPF